MVSIKGKKINGAPLKPSELFCFKDRKKFAASLFFLAACNKKFQRANATDIAKDGNDPPDDWLKTGSARDSLSGLSWIHSLICITRSLENNAFSVLHYVMVALYYITLCYIDLRFFLPLEQSRTALLRTLYLGLVRAHLGYATQV